MFRRLFHFILKHLTNQTRAYYARSVGVHLGQDCRLYSAQFGSEPYLVALGDHVTVSDSVLFVTHDGGVWVLRHLRPDLDDVRPIIVEDNVFIGARAIILPGVIIGRDSVVAAGAVVTKSVEPGSVVAGVPARVISTFEKYAEKTEKGLPTKGLTSAAKRDALLTHWGKTPQEWRTRLKVDAQ